MCETLNTVQHVTAIYIYICIHICIHTCYSCVHIYVYIYIYIYIYTYVIDPNMPLEGSQLPGAGPVFVLSLFLALFLFVRLFSFCLRFVSFFLIGLVIMILIRITRPLWGRARFFRTELATIIGLAGCNHNCNHKLFQNLNLVMFI